MTTWIAKPGNAIDLDLQVEWSNVAGDSVDFGFPVFCGGAWVYARPLEIDFIFDDEWAEADPLHVDFLFTCAGDEAPDFTYFDGPFTVLNGSSSYLDISATAGFAPRAYTGEVGSAQLSFTFKFTAQSGEDGGAVLTISISPSFTTASAYAGEAATGEIATTLALSPFAYSGETGSSALAVALQLGTITHYTGELGTSVLDTRPAWTPTFVASSGELGSVALSTDSPFSTINGYDGDLLSVVLTDYAADLFSPLVYVSELTEIGLATDATFTFRAVSGETATPTLTTYPAPNMEATGYSGEVSEFTFQIGRQLGTITGCSGENSSAIITNADNWIVKTGELGEFELATDPIFPMSYYGGEHASAVLRTGPSEPIGTFNTRTGESGAATLITMPSAILQPNPILQWHDVIVGFDTGTSFDLLNAVCCPVLDTYERIELNEMEPPDIQYSGTKIIFTADLSTRPRFYLNAYQGERFDIVDPNWFDTFRVYTGEVGRSASPEFEFHNFNLCYGNLIPDSEFADVELVDLTTWNCEAHVAYSGETMSVPTLQNNAQFQPVAEVGTRLDLVLTIDPAMLLRAYSGETFKWINMEIGLRAYTGQSATLAFYEPPLDAHSGQQATLVALTTEYAVAFSELGCLDNEFIPADEDGDPDPDNANPVPVELDFFVHSIKARCF